MLWAKLQRLRDSGYRFRRQAPFRGYFLDFVCYQRRLVVEVDGSQHGFDRQIEHDAVRDRVLMREGYTVLRFWTVEVRQNLQGVMDRIIQVLETAPPTRQPTLVAPSRGSPTLLAGGELSLPIKGGKGNPAG